MNYIYPFLVSFLLVFVSELGDKTQLLVLSVANKDKIYKILLGVAIGSFMSHGIAILFGSNINLFSSSKSHFILKFISYISFIFIGLISIIPKKKSINCKHTFKDSVIEKLSNLRINYCFIIALCILIGEIGDKTFIASIGLALQYPSFKISLILGAVTAMVLCNFIVLLFGKFLNKYVSSNFMDKFSAILFLIIGFLGLSSIF